MSYKKRIKKAVKELTKNPQLIEESWGDPANAEGGILFDFVVETRAAISDKLCLTQVRDLSQYALQHKSFNILDTDTSPKKTISIIDAIRKDDRLPLGSQNITVENLHIFGEYQIAFHKYKKNGKYKKLMKRLKEIRDE